MKNMSKSGKIETIAIWTITIILIVIYLKRIGAL